MVYDVDQRPAMKWMKQIWQGLKDVIMLNCWCSTAMIDTSNSVLKTFVLDTNS